MHNIKYQKWSSEGYEMIENAKDGQVRHSILHDNNTLIIKILRKRGYSLVDLKADYILDVNDKCLTNLDGITEFSWSDEQ